ncbi:MAG: transcription antitermination factor NusB [Chitinophagaceae bacterium]
MISRRNIRVKVMQTIYTSLTLDEEQKKDKAQKRLHEHFEQSKILLVYLLYFLAEVVRYAATDARQKAAKHLPTAEDLNTNTKIAGNLILVKLQQDEALAKQYKDNKPELIIDKELVKKIYGQLKNTDTYKNYIATDSRQPKEELGIITFILNDLILDNELFISHIEDNFSNWDDDADMLIQLMMAYLHKPGSIQFDHLLTKDKEEFANTLLQTVLAKEKTLQEQIIPKLKNWDPDRIAVLDMIMMEMGLAEFLFFETIPPKVTINEYIDIAKDYSTQQSGQFVNGILDNIHKELVQEGKMKKIAYKKN